MGNGRIITFYSYKGGTGRSMALANVAWILASNGKKVLVLDWDLEAPGLHRYLAPFLRDKDLTASDGLIDFVIKFATAAATPSGKNEREERAAEGWFIPYANILRYATSIQWKFERGGTIDFIPPGRQGVSYPTRVNSFNWQLFYDRLGGGALLEMAKDRMRAEYDYVLIDSRTGVSDTSGVCTVQMPDDLVVCFTLNNQSIEGAAAVARSVEEQRTKAGKPVCVFPVPMRVEHGEKTKLEARKALARERFWAFPNHLGPEERERYWGEVQVTYVPYYAYEEILACVGDNAADRHSVLAACEQIASYVTRHDVTRLVPLSAEDRQRLLREYEGGAILDQLREQERFAEGVLGRFSSEDQQLARQVFTRLVRVSGADELGGATLRWARPEEIEEPADRLVAPLFSAGLLAREDGKIRIADSALLEGWPRLRKWVEDDRGFLLWRQQLQDRIGDWLREEKSRRHLLTGTRLKEASDWLLDYGDRLNHVERRYVRESLAGVERASRNWRWVAVAAILVIIAGLTLLYPPETGYVINSFAIPQDRWAVSQDRSVAVAFSPSGNEDTVIWRTQDPWERRTRLPIPLGAVRVSSRGNYVAGMTDDGNFYVWSSQPDSPGKRLPAKIVVKGDQPLQVDFGFSPDERWIYVLWDTRLFLSNLGELAQGSVADPHEVTVSGDALTFSPKGRYAVVRKDSRALLFTLEPGSIEQKELNLVFPEEFAFSQDERWLAAAQGIGMALVDLESTSIREADTQSSVIGPRFSPDGKWLLAFHGSDIVGWSVPEFPGDQQTVVEGLGLSWPGWPDLPRIDLKGNWAAVSAGHRLFVWQLGGAAKVPPLTRNIDESLTAKLNPAGDWIAGGGKEVFVWRTGTFPSDLELAATYSGAGARTIQWSKDGQSLFAISPGEIFFGKAGEPLERIFSSSSASLQGVLVTGDQQAVVAFGAGGAYFIRKQLSMWGQTLKTWKWPALAERLEREEG